MKAITLSITLIIVTLLIFSFGSMVMNMDGRGFCPVMGMSVLCQMNPLEHIGKWQVMFTALPLEIIFVVFALLFLMIYAAFKYSLVPPSLIRYEFSSFNFFRSPLQEAFSDGILNPKIF